MSGNLLNNRGLPTIPGPIMGNIEVGGIGLASAPQVVSVSVNATGNFETTCTSVDTSKAAVVLPHINFRAANVTADIERRVGGYWTLHDATTPRFVCTDTQGSGSLTVYGQVIELSSGAVQEISQSMSMTSSWGTDDETVTACDHENAIVLPRDIVMRTGNTISAQWWVEAQAATTARWHHIAGGAFTWTGYAAIFSKS